jgi:type I restriction enzyme S subunit
LVKQFQFVMNHMDLLTGFIDISKYDGVTSPDYRVFESSNSNVNTKYYLYIFQICYWNRIFYGLGQGVSTMGRWRLPSDMFKDFLLPFPTLMEQEQIVKYLDNQTNEIDNLISIEKNRIETLKEYRQSLISEVVTGKIRVCEEVSEFQEK